MQLTCLVRCRIREARIDDFHVLLRLFRTAHPGLSKRERGGVVERRRVTLTDVRQTFPIILNSRKSTSRREIRETMELAFFAERISRMVRPNFQTCEEAHNAFLVRFLERMLYMYTYRYVRRNDGLTNRRFHFSLTIRYAERAVIYIVSQISRFSLSFY